MTTPSRPCRTSATTSGGEYVPEDTIRFYALRLHEIGMIQSTPQTIIENGTDWSFFVDLKKTLKA